MNRQTLETFLKQATTKPICKPYLPFLKMARDCFEQNPIISYWTLCYVVEAALKNHNKPSDDFRKFLLDIMSNLESEKKSRLDDSKFSNEKEAQTFIEEYGNKLIEKAEENDELLEKPETAYKLYLLASNIFQMFTVFVRDDAENAKRVKFCKWKAVECFKKKKELEENPELMKPKPIDDGDDTNESSDAGSNNPGTSSSIDSAPGQCPYPNQSFMPNICPYPSGNVACPTASESSSSILDSFDPLSPNANNGNDQVSQNTTTPPATPPTPFKNSNTIVTPTIDSNSNAGKNTSKTKAAEAAEQLDRLNQELASLNLSESDSKRAELLCESALYAIRANDLLTAVETLKQTLELLYKRAKK